MRRAPGCCPQRGAPWRPLLCPVRPSLNGWSRPADRRGARQGLRKDATTAARSVARRCGGSARGKHVRKERGITRRTRKRATNLPAVPYEVARPRASARDRRIVRPGEAATSRSGPVDAATLGVS
jgi:hypothetical protein